MKVYDRVSRDYIDVPQYGQGKLEFLYGNIMGRVLLKIVISPATSRLYGWLKRRRSSAKDIPPFISEYNINMDDFEDREYVSFADFFTRRVRPDARPVDPDKNAFISPADSKVLLYRITDDLRMNIKGRDYSVDELVGGKTDVSSYHNGLALVFRLSMDDYHRYCFVDRGRLLSSYSIKGKLHTVSSLSKDYKIYKENSRVVTLYSTDNFSEIIQIEVGALLVGKIVNREVDAFAKGEEKGYFEPGGSTVIILVRDGIISIDDDIIEQSSIGIETKVLYGEKIGTAL
ncbi:phosphatidylserine decarboxylase [Ruminococcaceae bacterium YRB3002]|nr:phosphatidylserine decarboxylase [Ruminococcaceae bacterium YRB3002]